MCVRPTSYFSPAVILLKADQRNEMAYLQEVGVFGSQSPRSLHRISGTPKVANIWRRRTMRPVAPQWRSQGGPGGPWPPQTFEKFYFSGMNFEKCPDLGEMKKKCSRMKVICVILTSCHRKKNSARYCDPEKCMLLPPPPQ